MVSRIIAMQSFTSKVIVVVKMETQEVLILTGSILGRVDGVQCESLLGLFFFFYYCSFVLNSRVVSLLILNRCEWKLRS